MLVVCGGGGIPVTHDPGEDCLGVEGVIDKDLTSALLAMELDVANLLIITSTPGVYLDYGTDTERELTRLSLEEARRAIKEGQFPAGSMGPKIDASIQFLESSSSSDARVIITNIENMVDLL